MLKGEPWEGVIPFGKKFGNLYFVGTRPASTHIIDTGDGYLLIDPGYQESLYIVLEQMWECGLDPRRIRKILLTHGHFDHVDATEALVRICGAETYIAKAEIPLLSGKTYHYDFRPFKVDHYLEDGDTVTLGNTTVNCLLTPGHTDGTMSYFFPVTDGKKTVRAGMFGGAGLNTLKSAFIQAHDLPVTVRTNYQNSLLRLRGEAVDLTLGNHVSQDQTDQKFLQMAETGENPFIDPAAWPALLDSLQKKFDKLLETDPL